MATTMTVEVVSPEAVLYSGEAEMVITRTLGGGEIAFQPGHAPFLGALIENHTRVFLPGGTVEDIAVHGGFVEVSGLDSYNAGHIPGAVQLHPGLLQAGTAPAPGRLPGPDRLEELLSHLGVEPTTHVVASDDEGGGWAGRLACGFLIKRDLQRIFDYRARAMLERFGGEPSGASVRIQTQD